MVGRVLGGLTVCLLSHSVMGCPFGVSGYWVCTVGLAVWVLIGWVVLWYGVVVLALLKVFDALV